ncbi:MAG: FAD-dependent oxidoreductase, partial [Rhodobacteraceae bacterium]|nr:FAD-dependent oxidoreductase [Paracoccaceae bacterium]
MSPVSDKGVPAVNGDVSYWHRDAGGTPQPRDLLRGPARADICIVGAGFTGLWTAYYLKRAVPTLEIVVLERAFAGFGASGRNGGWLTGGFAWSHRRYEARAGREGVRAMIAALAMAPAEVIAVAAREGIAACIHPTDELALATNAAQWDRARAELEARQSWEVPEDRVSLVDAAAAGARVDVPGLRGAFVQHGVARVQPALLVRGLADVVRRMGVRLHEGTAALSIAPGRVATPVGEVRAPTILRATEGFTAGLAGHRRDWLPLNSAMVITERLPERVWSRIGWLGRELVGDMGHVYFYAQRTDDGRIALGGRGQPYRYASRIDSGGEVSGVTIRRLVSVLHRLFPAVREVPLAHAWGGVLGVPRDWCASVGLDRGTGLG